MILKKYILQLLIIFYNIIEQNKTIYKYNLLFPKYFKLKNIQYYSHTLNIQHKNNLKLNHALKWLQFKNINFTLTKSLLNFYSIYHLQEYFTLIWNYTFCFRATNLINIVKRYYKLVKNKIRWTKMSNNLQFIYPQDIYNLFFCSFMIKDIFLIQTWIKKQFERKSIKLYKSLIYTIWFLMKIFGWQYRQYNCLTGIFLTFKGKLVKGGSRKKLMTFSFGNLKSSAKWNKFLSTSFVLRTISGSVSCKLYLTF